MSALSTVGMVYGAMNVPCYCDNCGSSKRIVDGLAQADGIADPICCEMPNPDHLHPVEVLEAAQRACRFPDRFSEMSRDQLRAYQTLRNAENYLLGNGMAVLTAS